ncbi:MAG: phosphomethylpyrimidine kinase [Bacteroidetes bacterium]|nr:phosphomethylpyrimidine kinase [Bacteroidota bacterium]
MKTFNVALTIAGSDSGGCAGIQADLKTFSSLGVFGTSAITSITAQNTVGVNEVIAIDSNMVRAQIKAVLDDFDVRAIKTGMLLTPENVIAIKELHKENIPLIIDPVMVSTSGNSLIFDKTIEAIKQHLFPIATIITPNLDEASILLSRKIITTLDMTKAAKDFIDLYGVNAVLIKGGHLDSEDNTNCIDVLLTKDSNEPIFLESQRIITKNSHGTGCTLSSAIAGYIALGYDLIESVKMAKDYITNAIYFAKDINLGHGHGAVNHFFNPKKLNIIETNK